MGESRIVMLAVKGRSTNIVFNALRSEFNIQKVVIEDTVDRKTFLKRRAKRLGWWSVFGQVLFQGLIGKTLAKTSRKRIHSILEENNLDDTSIPSEHLIEVPSVNARATLKLLKELNPDIIIVNGTRIISKKVLNGLKATFINMHAGITPAYRGVHGGYWALAKDDAGNFGVTVHLVDPGIDTGDILYQQRTTPSKTDNFATYPMLQIAAGIPHLIKAVRDTKEGKLKTHDIQGESSLYYHPTFWGYIWRRIRKGVH